MTGSACLNIPLFVLLHLQNKVLRSIGIYRKAHDRFLIVDSKIYHIGASIKDLGKKIFGLKDLDVMDLLNKIGVDSYSYMNENTNR